MVLIYQICQSQKLPYFIHAVIIHLSELKLEITAADEKKRITSLTYTPYRNYIHFCTIIKMLEIFLTYKWYQSTDDLIQIMKSFQFQKYTFRELLYALDKTFLADLNKQYQTRHTPERGAPNSSHLSLNSDAQDGQCQRADCHISREESKSIEQTTASSPKQFQPPPNEDFHGINGWDFESALAYQCRSQEKCPDCAQ